MSVLYLCKALVFNNPIQRRWRQNLGILSRRIYSSKAIRNTGHFSYLQLELREAYLYMPWTPRTVGVFDTHTQTKISFHRCQRKKLLMKALGGSAPNVLPRPDHPSCS